MKTLIRILCILVLTGLSGLSVTAQWSYNGTHIYNTNAGNVGIGTNSPATLLFVGKNMTEPAITVRNMGGIGGATYTMMDDVSGANWKFKATNSGGFKIRDHASSLDVITIEKGSIANAMYIDIDGNVAMSTSSSEGHGLNVINYTEGKAAVQGLDHIGGNTYAAGMLGVLNPSLLGIPVSVFNIGVLGIKPNIGWTGAAVYGWNTDAINTDNYGGIFVADGAATGNNYGVYGMAKYASINLAGKFYGRVEVDGHPSITEAPDYLQTVLKATVNHTLMVDTKAVDGISMPVAGYGIGVNGQGGYMGVRGDAYSSDYSGWGYGVYGYATGTTGTRVGVFGYATGGTTNWAGYFSGDAYISSDLRIGTTTQATGYSLSVNGNIACEEVLVEDMTNWPDYVFAEDYKLMSLDELEQSILKNGHLPGVPAAADIEGKGLLLGDMQKRLIEKVEELTLYTISQGKMITELQQKVELLEKENAKLGEKINQ